MSTEQRVIVRPFKCSDCCRCGYEITQPMSDSQIYTHTRCGKKFCDYCWHKKGHWAEREQSEGQ